ncbi:TetR/AcrR family transcriptional regulator [Limnobacter litoralis]|uniref:TetR family transcriptional regulator n=1 Tax=Limnobacter litoralis TaxID=481366 RepID=A0ABQ5YLG6_9BURK|nr:TetR/AcrR family transcriptional regulator [Limnobacter litoralis]GLR25400.1 TetR family transcriptional regulator [Limnobacter litoralis]
MLKATKESKGPDDGRRGDIVRAAARLFRDKGYDGASMRAIANAVGMQCGSPFYHFASKQDILVAVVEEGLRQGLEKTRAVISPSLIAREQFLALVKVHLSIILEEGNDFIPVMLYNWRCLDDMHQRRLIATKDEYDAIWQDAINALAKDGLIQSEPKFARLMILGSMNFMVTWYKQRPGDSLETLADKVVQFCLCS